MKTNKRKWFSIAAIVFIAIAGTLWFLYRDELRAAQVSEPVLSQLNPNLPDARNTPHPGWTKLDYYKQADLDSAKRKAEQARDPYYVLPELERSSADAQADAVTRQLDALQKELHKPAPTPRQSIPSPLHSANISPDVQKLETIVAAMKEPFAGVDPEIEQLGELLDKIKDLQQPERKQKATSNGRAYAVTDVDQKTQPGFFGLMEDTEQTVNENVFAAVVADHQTLVSGAVIKLRLSQEILVNNYSVPADANLFGIAQLSGERLQVEVNNIRLGQHLLPVKLSVYDADGLPGIYIPGAITRDVAKQSAAQSMSSLGLGSFDPSLGAQAASAGIQAAKSLLQKKVQLVRVSIPAGYQVLLKNQ